MNRSTWIGVAAGIGIATAGGVAAYSYLDEPSAALSAGAQEECWDEQVTTVTDPTDRNRIAGTVIGAVVGGAVGKDVGDRDITTAVGAAAGALIGRRIQEENQDNHAEQRTVSSIERRCVPTSSQ